MISLEERKEGISKQELEETALRFRIGDVVSIPAALIEDYDREKKNPTEAVVQQICEHHIVFNRTTDTLSELRYKRKHEPDNAIREIYTQAESTCEDILARLREAQRKTKRGRA